MTVNKLEWQEGSEITVDAEVEAAATGWTLSYVGITRIGSAVLLHLEAAFALGAAGLVCTLPSDFAPGATVTSPDGKFTVAADGTVHYTGSTGSSGSAVCDLNYLAAAVSP